MTFNIGNRCTQYMAVKEYPYYLNLELDFRRQSSRALKISLPFNENFSNFAA